MVHFHKELEKIKKLILSLSAVVEERVNLAVIAVLKNNAEKALEIIKKDQEIDEREVEVEEECLKVMALYQPVAIDLRFLITVIKINSDLERIADQAVNIAERVQIISKQMPCDFVYDYTIMAQKAQKMLHDALDAFVHLDVKLAHRVIAMDDEVDQLQSDAYDVIKQAMEDKRDCLSYLINLLLVSRHLERLADHATNIAEEVIYLIEGEIVRHTETKEG